MKENKDLSPKDKKALEELEKVYDDYKGEVENHYSTNTNLVDTSEKIIVDFKEVADGFSTFLKYLLLLCVFIYVIILLISFFNVINFIYLCIKYSFNLFYNPIIINNDTLSFNIKKITTVNKNDFSNDICNIYSEQLATLSIFNMTIYIFYIVLAYIFIYILYILYGQVMQYTHKVVGNIKDIDPDADLAKLTVLIFGLSVVHIIIYRLLIKDAAIKQYKKSNEYENNLDNIILNFIDAYSPVKYTTTDKSFYELLNDTTKYELINDFFENKINKLNDDGEDIGKYMYIYNLYNYFSEFLIMNDVNIYRIGIYLRMIENKNNNDKITFIALLDNSNKRLIKLHHEELKFYKNIPKDKVDLFKTINNDVINNISTINKLIISYGGNFIPFIMITSYIVIIFIYNIIAVYLLFEAIHETKSKNLFPASIYYITDNYKKFINKLLDRE